MAPKRVKFGILSTANIANTVAAAIKAIPEAECTTIASRDTTKAKAFAENHDIPEACSYDELLTLPIDAVYIPLPTAMKARWAVRFAKAGKHILVEKPLGSTKEVQEMMEACEDAGVVFLDGTHFVHSLRTKELQQRISAGDIGAVRRVDASFSVPVSRVAENIRSDTSLEPQGFLGDLAWYCARAAVAYLGAELTSKVSSATCSATFHPRFPGCVQRGAGVVQFGTKYENVSLCYSFDSACSWHQRVAIIGERGMLETLDFVEPLNHSAVFQSIRPPEKYTTDTEYIYESTVDRVDNGGDFHTVFPCRDRVVVKEPGNLSHPETMIHEFCRLILHDDKNSAKIWAKESLATQAILDKIMSKIEV